MHLFLRLTIKIKYNSDLIFIYYNLQEQINIKTINDLYKLQNEYDHDINISS